jgi:RimJ/RimL family protein N-acetyltransferase
MVFFIRKSDGALVGGSGVHDADWDIPSFEIGYWGHSCFAGQGLITEGVAALSEYALESLKASRVFLTNTASWRLAERAGFELEGILRNDCRNLSGGLRSTRVYSKISSSHFTEHASMEKSA